MDNVVPSKLEGPSQEGKDLQTSTKLLDDSRQAPAGSLWRDTAQELNKLVGVLNTNLLAFGLPGLSDKPADAKPPASAPSTPGKDTSTPAPAPSSGIIPPFMFEELARRNPNNHHYSDMLKKNVEVLKQTEMHPNIWPFPSKPKDYHGDREVYDAEGKSTHPGKKARFEGDKATGNNEVDKAYDFTGEVRSFYKDLYQRNSIDGKGMKFISTVNYGDNYNNAYWNGSQMTYGKPGPDSPFKTFMLQDVCGHEITHGVTEKESHLQYYGQAGALNESISDVFGELIKQHANHQTAKEADWLVGAGIWKDNIHGKALRDMLHPGTAYDDPKVGKDKQPGNMKDYLKTTSDNGGVHTNSGIPSRAFALFATNVGGNAWDEPGHVWFAARKSAGSNPSFAQFAYQTIEQAKKLGFKSDVPKLEKAWEDVGVKPSATEKDLSTPKKPLIPIGWKRMDGDEENVPKKDNPAA